MSRECEVKIEDPIAKSETREIVVNYLGKIRARSVQTSARDANNPSG
ncbi:hypothetical protein GR247_40970, partial [Rhizobium leguminosarum]|nr:hypothetical protein [Rhizobium leguminosarum]